MFDLDAMSGRTATAIGKMVMVAITLAIAHSASAQTTAIPTTATMTVTAQIVAGCGIVGGGAANGLNFGTIDYGTHPAITRGSIDATSVGGTLQVECSPNLVINLSIGAGNNSPNGDGQRNLAGPNGKLIPYSLYFDSARTRPFVVGQAVSTTVSGAVSIPIYGRASLSGGSTPTGTYTDVAQVTLTY